MGDNEESFIQAIGGLGRLDVVAYDNSCNRVTSATKLGKSLTTALYHVYLDQNCFL